MIRIAKLTDYAIVLMSYMARRELGSIHTARDLAEASALPMPTVSKVLKALARARLLDSHRGVTGGYSLTRNPEEISVAEIISAMEGPIAVTECSSHSVDLCNLERICPVRSNWLRINRAVLGALRGLTLDSMMQPLPASWVEEHPHGASASQEAT